jgi:hypothetical protein
MLINFGIFDPFSANKYAMFSESNVMINLWQKIGGKIAKIGVAIFWRKYYKTSP